MKETSSQKKRQHAKTISIKANEAAECGFMPRQNDFFADSPYFSAFVEKEMYSLGMMTSAIKDIVDKTKAFSKIGAQMAMVTRNLASSCRFGPEADCSTKAIEARRDALGHDMASSLEHLGEVLDEVASAQEHMCRIFETSLAMHMDIHTSKETQTVNVKEEATSESEEAEELFFQYINGKNAGGNFNETNYRNSIRQEVESIALAKSIKVARWKHDLRKILARQTSAELKRFRLARRMVQTKFEHNSDLSNVIGRLMNEMCTCFSHCGGLVSGILPLTKKMEVKCKQAQVEHETKDYLIWQERENNLVDTLALMEVAESKAQDDVTKKLNSATQNRSKTNSLREFEMESIEHKSKIWGLSSTLATLCNYNRTTPPGVLVEGWLYKNTRSLLHSSIWSRAWFVLKLEGIFAFWSSDELRRQKKNNSTAKEKVCDVELCTVKVLKDDDPSARFRFELIVPKYSKPIVLQARGPHELKKWVDGIRTAISQRLSAGDFNNKSCRFRGSSFKLNRGRDSNLSALSVVGRNREVVRQSTEIRSTILEMQEVIMKYPINNKNIETIDEVTEAEDSSVCEDDFLDPIAKQLMGANPICADCEMESPDWVSLNLGILICLQCSGVHRSLGVHISKVRSLRLDSLSNQEAGLILAIGNDCANKVWEKEVNSRPGRKKPCAFAARQFREAWIKSKYVKKEFTGFSDIDSTEREQASRDIYHASKRGDVFGVMHGLVQGGLAEWKNKMENNQTHIDVCGTDIQGGGKKAECIELLLQNGAKVKSLDDFSASTTESESSLDDFSYLKKSNSTKGLCDVTVKTQDGTKILHEIQSLEGSLKLKKRDLSNWDSDSVGSDSDDESDSDFTDSDSDSEDSFSSLDDYSSLSSCSSAGRTIL